MSKSLEDLFHEYGIVPPRGFAPGRRFYALCPQCSHQRKPSHQKSPCLGINVHTDGVSFDGGCNHCGWRVGARVGQKGNGRANGHDEQPAADAKFLATYDYLDESWTLSFQVCRIEGKAGFPQRHLSATGEWVWGLDGVRRVLYRLPELLKAVDVGELIIITEGEKDANNVWRRGVAATCNPGGAGPGKWLPEFSQFLRGADVVIIPDHDDPGYEHAKAIASSLRRVARRIRMLTLADHWPEVRRKKGGDVSNGFEEGRTIDELLELIAKCPEWENPFTQRTLGRRSGGGSLMATTFVEQSPVIPRFVPEGLTLLGGRPKMGKSWWALGAAISVALARSYMGYQCRGGEVLYLALEDTKRRMHFRLRQMLGAGEFPELDRRLDFLFEFPMLSDGGVDVLWDWCRMRENPRLIVIDVLARVRTGRKPSEDAFKADYDAVEQLTAVTKEFPVGILAIVHQRKSASDYDVDTLSGTLGQAAAIDHYLLLERKGGVITMTGDGRDMPRVNVSVEQDEQGWWQNKGYLGESGKSSPQRGAIVDLLVKHNKPMSVGQIADELHYDMAALRVQLSTMVKDGDLERVDRGYYALPQSTIF